MQIYVNGKKKYLKAYSDLLQVNKGIKIFNDYNVISSNFMIELGGKELIKSLSISNVIMFLSEIFGRILTAKKPYLDYSLDVNVYTDEKKLNVYNSTVVVVNILMVILTLVKTLMENIKNGKRKS